jgi:serine/threonine protein kinase
LQGYFLAGPSTTAAEMEPEVDQEDAIWVVLKWENFGALQLYPSAQQTSGFGLGKLFGRGGGDDRARMLKAITRGMVNAVAYCHERSVIHGSLSGSFLLSSFDDSRASSVIVKLQNVSLYFLDLIILGHDSDSGVGGYSRYSLACRE